MRLDVFICLLCLPLPVIIPAIYVGHVLDKRRSEELNELVRSDSMSSQRILKFPLLGGGAVTTIKCRFVRVLDIQVQRSTMAAWVLADDSAPEAVIELVPIRTGWEIPSEVFEKMKYFKTVQDSCGYVWHYYMKG